MQFFKNSKKILHIAFPLLSSRLVKTVTFFVGFVMIAKLGPETLAASSLASSLFITCLMIGAGTLYAIGIKISHAYGQKNQQKIREYFHSGILLAVLLAVLATLILIILSFMLPLLGQHPFLIPYTKQFIYALCLPMLPTLLNVVGNQLVVALSKPRIVLINSLINFPITIIILYLLIFGGLGIPSLGIWGFGWAFFVSDTLLCFGIVLYITNTPYFKSFKLWNFRPSISNNGSLVKRLVELSRLGLSMGVQFGAEVAGFSVKTFLIGRFGIGALNSYQITSQIVIVALMIPFTISEAAAILVGQAIGTKQLMKAKHYGLSSALLGTLLLFTIAAIFYIFPQQLISLYLDIRNPRLYSTVHLSVLFLYTAAISQIFDGIRNIVSGSLRGLHDAKFPMYIGILIVWAISVPVGSLLAFYTAIGPIGFQISAILAFLIGSIILFIRFQNHWKNKCASY